MSRQTMIGGAAGLITGAVASAIYGGVGHSGAYQAVITNCSLPMACTPTSGYSDIGIAGLMVGLPLAGAAIAAGVKAWRFHAGQNDAQTTSPMPAEREPFWTKKLGVRAAIGAGVGLVVGGISSGAAALAVKLTNDITVQVCKYQVATSDNGVDCDPSDGISYDYTTPHVANSFISPTTAIACSMALLPVACAAIEVGRNALQRDYRKNQ